MSRISALQAGFTPLSNPGATRFRAFGAQELLTFELRSQRLPQVTKSHFKLESASRHVAILSGVGAASLTLPDLSILQSK